MIAGLRLERVAKHIAKLAGNQDEGPGRKTGSGDEPAQSAVIAEGKALTDDGQDEQDLAETDLGA